MALQLDGGSLEHHGGRWMARCPAGSTSKHVSFARLRQHSPGLTVRRLQQPSQQLT